MGVERYRETMDSTQHLKQYCDHIGVTDKYTGFRHNLNRGSRNPVNLGYTWMKNTPPPPCPPPPIAASWSQPARPATTGHISTSSDYTPNRHGAMPSSALLITTKGHMHAQRSIQERCGINMKFPGRTEYMQRYHIKGGPSGPPVQDLSRGYTLNPLPDFEGVAKRPMARQMYTKNFSEYQTRYLFPDGSTITKFPWLRK